VANRRCSFIKPGGERCRGIATGGADGTADLCYAHDPARAEERSRNARKAGRTGGNGRSSGLSETAEAKRWIKVLVSGLLKGTVERDVATACFMGLGTLARFIEVERRLKEQEQVIERIEQIEDALEAQKGGDVWGIGTG
jgi:hypothetical protein